MAVTYSEIWDKPQDSNRSSNPVEDVEGAIQELEKIRELKQEIADLEEERRIAALSIVERIAELELKALQLAKAANNESVVGLQAKKDLLEVEKELVDLKEKAADEAKKAAEAAEREAERLAALKEQQAAKTRSDAEGVLGALTGRIGDLLSSPTDSLTRIGGGRIGSNGFRSNILKSLLDQQREAVKHLRSLDKKAGGSSKTPMLP